MTAAAYLKSTQTLGGNGRMGVCARCVDLVPVVTVDGVDRCGNERDHRRGDAAGVRWGPTKRHVLVRLDDADVDYCRHCRAAVQATRQGCPARGAHHAPRGVADTEGAPRVGRPTPGVPAGPRRAGDAR